MFKEKLKECLDDAFYNHTVDVDKLIDDFFEDNKELLAKEAYIALVAKIQEIGLDVDK